MVNVFGGAPFGYRYMRRSDDAEARYEIVEQESAVVREMFRRYVEDNLSIADLARWLSAEGVPTSTGKARWDRSTIWGMLRNPAYAGRAAYLKTGRVEGAPALNRTARRQGRAVSRHARTRPRPIEDRIEIAVPAIVDDDTFAAAARRLEDNRRFSARNTKEPSLLMGLVSCHSCGYAYYRTSTRTKTRKLYYYRCLGSDDYRYEHGRICENQPVRADYLDELVWGQLTALLADPGLVQAELDRRLAELHAANPATAERSRLELELTRATKSIERLVHGYQEDLLTLDELRARMPDLRAKEASLRGSLASLEAQLLDRDTYLKLAEDLEGFLGRLRETADTATIEARQKVLRSVVKEVLVGPERVVIRHSIPVADHPFRPAGYRLRLRRQDPALRGAGVTVPLRAVLGQDARFEERLHQGDDTLVSDPNSHPGQQRRVVDPVEARLDVALDHPLVTAGSQVAGLGNRIVRPTVGAEAVRTRIKVRFEDRLQHQLQGRLHDAVGHRRDPQTATLARPRLWNHPLLDRQRLERSRAQRLPHVTQERCLSAFGLDVVGRLAVHARRASALVVPHPIPRHNQKRRIGYEVEQIIKPAVRILTRPSVQLGLDPQYPRLGHHQRRPRQRLAGIHQRPPGIPASSLRTRWPPSPCERLSRPRTTTRPPPRP